MGMKSLPLRFQNHVQKVIKARLGHSKRIIVFGGGEVSNDEDCEKGADGEM